MYDFFILRLGLESGPGGTNFHYSHSSFYKFWSNNIRTKIMSFCDYT